MEHQRSLQSRRLPTYRFPTPAHQRILHVRSIIKGVGCLNRCRLPEKDRKDSPGISCIVRCFRHKRKVSTVIRLANVRIHTYIRPQDTEKPPTRILLLYRLKTWLLRIAKLLCQVVPSSTISPIRSNYFLPIETDTTRAYATSASNYLLRFIKM